MNVNPTRMELTNLKRKLVTARRGHKLLKDKREELMRRFLDMVRENKELRREVAALKDQVQDDTILKEENAWLKEYLAISDDSPELRLAEFSNNDD